MPVLHSEQSNKITFYIKSITFKIICAFLYFECVLDKCSTYCSNIFIQCVFWIDSYFQIIFQINRFLIILVISLCVKKSVEKLSTNGEKIYGKFIFDKISFGLFFSVLNSKSNGLLNLDSVCILDSYGSDNILKISGSFLKGYFF